MGFLRLMGHKSIAWKRTILEGDDLRPPLYIVSQVHIRRKVLRMIIVMPFFECQKPKTPLLRHIYNAYSSCSTCVFFLRPKRQSSRTSMQNRQTHSVPGKLRARTRTNPTHDNVESDPYKQDGYRVYTIETPPPKATLGTAEEKCSVD